MEKKGWAIGAGGYGGYKGSPYSEHSSRLEHDVFLSARDRVVGHVPQVRVDVIIEDERARSLLDEIRGSCAFGGKGIYWIMDIDEAGDL